MTEVAPMIRRGTQLTSGDRDRAVRRLQVQIETIP